MSTSQPFQSLPQDESCPECGGQLSFDEKRGETACQSCGLVINEDQIDHGPEWRSYNDESNQRAGAPNTELRHDRGIGFTRIPHQNRDANGHQIKLEKRRKLARLRRYHKQSQTGSTKERNIRKGITEILRMGSALGMNKNVKETATVIFRRASQKDVLAGRSIEAIASSAIYAAIRLIGLPIQIPEVEQVSRVHKRRIEHGYGVLNRELGLEISPRSPEDYIPKILSELNKPDMEQTGGRATYANEADIEFKARELIKIARENNLLSGKSPIGIAGAAIYTADQLLIDKPHAENGVTLNQRAIGDTIDKSTVTIRTRFQEMMNAFHEHKE